MDYGTGVAITQLALTATGALALATIAWAFLASGPGQRRQSAAAKAAATLATAAFLAACSTFIVLAPERQETLQQRPAGETQHERQNNASHTGGGPKEGTTRGPNPL